MGLASSTPSRDGAALAVTCVALTISLAAWIVPPRHSPEAGAAAAKTETTSAYRVGLVFDVGGRGDKSFNDAAYDGLMRAHRELGIQISYLEPAGTEDREAALRLFAAEGMDLIVGVGFIFSSDIDAVANDYPKVNFAGIDYAPGPNGPPPNVEGLVFRDEEGAFLVGAVAGALSTHKHVGFVGGMVTPLIRKFEVGFLAGVAATCKECKQSVAYAGTTPDAFRDPAKGHSIAISQIASGADVLFHASGATGRGVFAAADTSHVFAIGVDRDQYDEMPDAVVTSMIKRGDVALFEAIRSAQAGHFLAGMHALGVAEGAITYVSEGPHASRLTGPVIAKVEALRARIIAGEIHVPFE